MLSGQYLKLVVVANLIGWPAAWYIIRTWLESFAYRADLTFEPFIYGTLLTLVVAFLAVVYQTMFASQADPISELRQE